MLKHLTIAIAILLHICTFAQTDPNADPNWDWTSNMYTMYMINDQGQIISYPLNSPWGQPNSWEGLQDNKKADGWKLVARDFGTPTRAKWSQISPGSPFFILYNEYKGLLRFFMFVQAQSEYSYGTVTLKHGNTQYSATLSNLSPRSRAADQVNVIKDNVGSALVEVYNGGWIWADFQMAYDPDIVATNDGIHLDFTIEGTEESSVIINGIGTGINGQKEEVRKFMTSSHGSPLIPRDAPSKTNNVLNLNELITSVSGTQANWNSFKETLSKLLTKVPAPASNDPLNSKITQQKNDATNIIANLNLESLPTIGAIAGFFDYLISGGKSTDKQKAGPTYFGFNVKLEGTIRTTKLLPNPQRISVPSSKLSPLSGAYPNAFFPLLYNNNVGIFNLKKTPVLEYKTYQRVVAIYPPPYNEIKGNYLDIKIKDPLEWAINPTPGLIMDSIQSWIIANVTNVADIQLNGVPFNDIRRLQIGVDIDNNKLFLENSLEGGLVLRNKITDGYIFHNRTVQIPGTVAQVDIAVKIKATFHRSDDPSALPIVTVMTFHPQLVNQGTGRWPVMPEPFSVDISRSFEFDPTEIFTKQYSFDGQPITVSSPATINKNGKIYSFISWSDGSTANPRTITSNLNVCAQYKVIQKSNNANTYTNNSQRKIVRTLDGWLHQVYESNGRVWYEAKSPTGNWQLMNNGQPLDNGEAKCPSIDWHYNPPYTNMSEYFTIAVVYQQKSGTSYTIEYTTFRYENGTYVRKVPTGSGTLYAEPSGGDQYTAVNANPNIAWGGWNYSYGYSFVLTFERKSTAGSMQPGIYWIYGFLLENSIASPQPNQPVRITGTNSSSLNAAVYLNKCSVDITKFNVIYQSGTTSPINIVNVPLSCSYNGNWVTSQDPVSTISYPSGVSNYKPSMVQMSNNTIGVCWIRDLYGSGSGTPYYINAVYWNSASPNTYTYSGNMVNSVSLNLLDGTSDAVYAYAQNTNNSVWQNFARKGSNTKTLTTTGRHIQLSNGTSTSDMYASAYYPVSLPYYFQSESLGGLNKSSDDENTYGRGVVLSSDDFGFSYSMKSLKAGSSIIKFIEIPESKAKRTKRTGIEKINLDSLNTFLLSEPFTMEEGMTISFSEGAGFIATGEKTETSASQLSEKDYLINSKIELIEDGTGKSIAVIKQGRFTPQDKDAKDLKATDVKITGKDSKTVRLKITLEANMKGIEGMLVNEFNTVNETILGKLSAEEITLQETAAITSYALDQNYPNPFNPVTTISYQLPEDGYVTLKIYDILGKEITTLVKEYKSHGRYIVDFDASNLSSGTYIYELRVNDYSSVKKLMVLK